MKMFLTRAKYLFLTLLVYGSSSLAWGQQLDLGQASRALDTAQDEIVKFVKPLIGIAYIVAMIMGIAGAIRVHKKFQDGDQDGAKSAGALLGGAIFFIIILFIFDKMFLGNAGAIVK